MVGSTWFSAGTPTKSTKATLTPYLFSKRSPFDILQERHSCDRQLDLRWGTDLLAFCSGNTAPTTDAVIVDVNLDGTTGLKSPLRPTQMLRERQTLPAWRTARTCR